MQVNIPTTTRRELALEAFRRSNLRARLSRALQRLLSGTAHTLLDFGERAAGHNPARRPRGVQDIPVERILGSLGRARDFDPQFRPLKKHLRDRWVRIFLDLDATGWEPIRVHRLGEEYFVEDGHHRVSVARHFGLGSIRAEVWEHTPPPPAIRESPRIHIRQAGSTCCSSRHAAGCAS